MKGRRFCLLYKGCGNIEQSADGHEAVDHLFYLVGINPVFRPLSDKGAGKHSQHTDGQRNPNGCGDKAGGRFHGDGYNSRKYEVCGNGCKILIELLFRLHEIYDHGRAADGEHSSQKSGKGSCQQSCIPGRSDFDLAGKEEKIYAEQKKRNTQEQGKRLRALPFDEGNCYVRGEQTADRGEPGVFPMDLAEHQNGDKQGREGAEDGGNDVGFGIQKQIGQKDHCKDAETKARGSLYAARRKRNGCHEKICQHRIRSPLCHMGRISSQSDFVRRRWISSANGGFN